MTRGRRSEYMGWLTPVYASAHAAANGHNSHNGVKPRRKSATAEK